MTYPLPVRRPDLSIDACLSANGHVFATFDDQDSGCRSFGLESSGRRWFVKHAPAGPPMESLRRAVTFHTAVHHPGIVAQRDAFPTSDGLAAVYDWLDGEVLYHPTRSRRPDRSAPASAHARFRAQPLSVILDAFDVVLAAHLEVVRQGFVAVDLYDGCLLYDFPRRRMRLVDLDEYRPGPFVATGGRLPGSTRFMAPEEATSGATIDERTTVFNLGRTALVLMDEGDNTEHFRGSPRLRAVAQTATASHPGRRFPHLTDFAAAWREASRSAH